MKLIKALQPGTKVHYNIVGRGIENGIVKRTDWEIDTTFVVFHCNNDWKNYQNYTAQSVKIQNFQWLKLGWK